MGKSNRTSSGEMIQKNWDDSVKGQQESRDRFDSYFPGAVDKANSTYNSATSNLNNASGGYQSVLDKFNLSKPGTLQSMYGANAAKYGTWDPERVAGIDKIINQIDDTGDRYHGYADDYTKFAHGDSDQGRYYSDLLNTGGFDENQKADFRGRANSVVPSIFDSMKRENDRLGMIQGGINPGYTGQSEKLARDAGQAGQDAVTAGEVQLQDMIRSGKMSGAEHLDSDFLNGMGGAVTATGGELNARNAATGARTELARNLGESSRSLAGMMVDEDKMRGDMVLGASGGLRGVGDSFTSLRGQVPGEVKMWLDNLTQNENMYMNERGQTTNAKASAEQEKWLKKQKIAKVAAAAVATYYTGGAASPLLANAMQQSTDGHGAGYTDLQRVAQNAPANSPISDQIWKGGM